MERRDWTGVFSAITTPFHPDHSTDYEGLSQHVEWMIDSGCRGIVPLGSLGEAATLSFDEKVRILEVCHDAINGRVPLIAGLSGMSTARCVALANAAESVGCDGIMVLPAYVHQGDWRETKTHFSAVIDATSLSCMLYNNPIAYGIDVTAVQIQILAREHENLHAVKESSGDTRRVTAIRELLDDHLAIFMGLDDVVVEGVCMGATGWIAGLVNALPEESVRLFDLAMAGRKEETRELYEWFLPLLRLDTVPKFVQLIKLVQAEVGRGTATVRPPRLELEGE
ncbi:MAG TPA: dihydrodipicolinate synthase family protein, partial [Chloroflexota bacterium]|nr:dihydrodipicolinate synthase family protein [Chloroflexota bacterium]